MKTLLSLVLAGVLFFLAINIRDPYLVWARGGSLPVFLLLGLGGVVLAWRAQRGRGLQLLVWAAVLCAAPLAEGIFQYRKHTVLAAPTEELQRLGRHFIVGYRSVEDVKPMVIHGLVAGVFLNRRNSAGRTVEELRQEIAELQTLRRQAGLPPLIVATDQEGGAVSHMSPPLPRLPNLAAVASLPQAQRDSAARSNGVAHGQGLAALGITVNLAPVVDLASETRASFDTHTRLHERAISQDPAVVMDLAVAYAQGLASAGVIPTAKHFPGLSGVKNDTHHFRGSLDLPLSQLEERIWPPFQEVLQKSNAWLMVAHVAVSAVDSDRLASHSKPVLDGIVRQKWGYDGIIITDDMNMGSIYMNGLCPAVGEALNAGVDLLLVSYDGQLLYRLMDCALTAKREGKIDEAMLDKSEKRLESARP